MRDLRRVFRRRSALFAGLSLGMLAAFAGAPVSGLWTAYAQDKPDQKRDNQAEKDDDREKENPFPRRFKAPEIDGGTGWLNTAGDITLKDLRGKVVLLDFWTYCCINCMHVLPDLEYLERKFDKQLVVIGVHSAKFDNEKESENIRRAIMRYEIEHPVINDSEMTVWRKFGVNAWPTLVLIDPEGYYCGYISGEGNREVLEQVLERLIAFHRTRGTLDETPVRFDLERERARPTPLKFPGKVLADEAGHRLFISDSNHNRIIIASLEGKLVDVIGTGTIGTADGAYSEAEFDHPQGMALVGNTLYVADTENHLIRAVDLDARRVTTVAGTGRQGQERRFGGKPLKTALNSPWDLVPAAGKLFIAMAGPHQIWVLDPDRQSIEPYAGSGREDILNGPLGEAALAQPSGITTDGESLYVVDSEGSAVRKVSLDPAGEVSTLVGASDLQGGRSLFEFGDRDGIGSEARLQHPLGLTWHAGSLYVADSYNHKLRKVDPAKKSITTWLGDGTAGDRNDPPRFSEPAGLSIAGRTLYVADTNNHQIRTVDLDSGETAILTIDGLTPPRPRKSSSAGEQAGPEPLAVKLQRVQGPSLAFEAALVLPEGYKLNKSAPLTYRVAAGKAQNIVASNVLGTRHEIDPPVEGNVVRFTIPVHKDASQGELKITVNFGYCRDGTGGLCKLGTLVWSVPVEVAANGSRDPIRLPGE